MICSTCRRIVHGRGRYHKIKFHMGFYALYKYRHKKNEEVEVIPESIETKKIEVESTWKKLWRNLLKSLFLLKNFLRINQIKKGGN